MYICYLCSQVRDGDKLLEQVLGQNVCVARLLDIVGADVDMVGTQVKVGGGDGSHAPFCLGTENKKH